MTSKRFLAYWPLTLMSALLLAGCAGGPSTSEAKEAVASALGDCKQIDIVDFDKVNGIADGDNRYALQVKYGLAYSPPAELVKAVEQLTSGAQNSDESAPTSIHEVRVQMLNGLRSTCPNLPFRIAMELASADLTGGAESIRINYTNDHLMMVKSDNGWVGE